MEAGEQPVQRLDAAPHSEIDRRVSVPPLAARLAYNLVGVALSSDQQTVTDEQKTALKDKKASDISYDTGAALSIDSRKDAYRDSDKTFAQQTEKWNKGLHSWITKEGASDHKTKVIAAIGLHSPNPAEKQSYTFTRQVTENGEQRSVEETVELFKTTEAFRRKYFGEKGEKSDIGLFVKDIANSCRTSEDQPVNMELLAERLEAVKDLFVIFGKKDSVDVLVKNYALTFGMMSQTDQKEAYITAAEASLQTALSGNEKTAMDALAAKQQQRARGDDSDSDSEGEREDNTLPPELAQSNPELFQQRLLTYLEQKSPRAKKLWDTVIAHGATGDKLIFDPTSWGGSINEEGTHAIKIGVEPMPDNAKHNLFFNDHNFEYKDVLAYILTHELSHALYESVKEHPDLRALLENTRAVRERYPDQGRGLSSLASHEHYKPGDDKSREDITELIAMYVWNPRQLSGHLDFLRLQSDEHLAGLGIAKIDNTDVIYGKIQNIVDGFFDGLDSTQAPTQQSPQQQPTPQT